MHAASNPRRLALAAGALLVLPACSTMSRTFDETIPADGVVRVRANVEQGEVDVRAGSPRVFQIAGRAWGRATTMERADRNADGNEWSVDVEGSVLDLTADSEFVAAGVDFDVIGPAVVDTRLTVERGRVALNGLRGDHRVDARRIDATDLHGFVILNAGHRIVAELDPEPGDVFHLAAEDGIALALPFGAPIDLHVWGDPERQVRVADLGWDEQTVEEDFFHGRVGDGSIRIELVGQDAEIDVTIR